MRKRLKYIASSIAILAIVAMFIYGAYINKKQGKKYIHYNQFIEMAEQGKISKTTISDGPRIGFFIKDDIAGYETDNPRTDSFKETLLKLGVEVTEGEYVSSGSMVQQAVSVVFFLAVFFVLYRQMGKNGRATAMPLNAQAASSEQRVILFDDVAGNEEAKESVADIVDFIENPEKYTKYGARMPRGVIFYGPPGTGKTLLAKAIAGEAKASFYAVSGSDFVQMFVGVGAFRVRELFKKARADGKSVIFIDEIDAIGKTRSASTIGGNDERDQTLNALLAEMSGFSSGEGVVVIAATNRLDTLDPALLRPGRFDRHVEIGLPDIEGRKRILCLHAKNKPLGEEVSIEQIAKQTVYFSGAMLENLMNEAAICAAKAGKGAITGEDVDRAYYTVLAGSEKKNRSGISQKDREITAYHEAGHGLAAKLLSPENTVSKITIIPSSKGAGGFCVNIPPDKMYYTKKEIENQVITTLAGRASEELVFGEDNITTGASNDIEKAAETVKDYVNKFGMSSISGLAPLSEQELFKEVRIHLDRFYNEAKRILSENRDILNAIASKLLENESLNENELNEVCFCNSRK